MERFPDFIIAGFPKCGTHALLHTLGDHPDTFTNQHEVGFFGGSPSGGDAFGTREDALFSLLGGEIPAWRAYDRFYSELVG